jgi:hypothetical protein
MELAAASMFQVSRLNCLYDQQLTIFDSGYDLVMSGFLG